MSKEQIESEDREIIEKQISSCLERSLYQKDICSADINMLFYYEHIKKYGSTDIDKYCRLKNKYNALKNSK